jgi:hypothetical protein
MPSRALEERFPPGTVVRVPVDGGFEAFLEVVERFPLQLALGKRGIDGVTPIMAEAAGDVANQALAFAAGRRCYWLAPYLRGILPRLDRLPSDVRTCDLKPSLPAAENRTWFAHIARTGRVADSFQSEPRG